MGLQVGRTVPSTKPHSRSRRGGATSSPNITARNALYTRSRSALSSTADLRNRRRLVVMMCNAAHRAPSEIVPIEHPKTSGPSRTRRGYDHRHRNIVKHSIAGGRALFGRWGGSRGRRQHRPNRSRSRRANRSVCQQKSSLHRCGSVYCRPRFGGGGGGGRNWCSRVRA
jgi:hypothetical protein